MKNKKMIAFCISKELNESCLTPFELNFIWKSLNKNALISNIKYKICLITNERPQIGDLFVSPNVFNKTHIHKYVRTKQEVVGDTFYAGWIIDEDDIMNNPLNCFKVIDSNFKKEILINRIKELLKDKSNNLRLNELGFFEFE